MCDASERQGAESDLLDIVTGRGPLVSEAPPRQQLGYLSGDADTGPSGAGSACRAPALSNLINQPGGGLWRRRERVVDDRRSETKRIAWRRYR